MKHSELIKLLREANCEMVRQGTRHEVWYSPITDKQFTVARHKYEVPTGTCNKILKTAGLK